MMTRRPALQSGDKVRIADGKFDPALIVLVKQVDGDLVEVQLGGGNSASFHRDQIRTVPDDSGSGDSARNTPESSAAADQVTPATRPELSTLAMRMPQLAPTDQKQVPAFLSWDTGHSIN